MTSAAIHRFIVGRAHRLGVIETRWFQCNSGDSAGSIAVLQDLAESPQLLMRCPGRLKKEAQVSLLGAKTMTPTSEASAQNQDPHLPGLRRKLTNTQKLQLIARRI